MTQSQCFSSSPCSKVYTWHSIHSLERWHSCAGLHIGVGTEPGPHPFPTLLHSCMRMEGDVPALHWLCLPLDWHTQYGQHTQGHKGMTYIPLLPCMTAPARLQFGPVCNTEWMTKFIFHYCLISGLICIINVYLSLNNHWFSIELERKKRTTTHHWQLFYNCFHIMQNARTYISPQAQQMLK